MSVEVEHARRTGRLLGAVTVLVVLAGCSAVTATPPEPTPADFEQLIEQRLDAVWRETRLDDAARPTISGGSILGQFEAAHAFSLCMQKRGWPDYFSHDTGYGYRGLQIARNDSERLEWYECFAAHPVDGDFGFASVAQYDFVYDYYRDSLIPCLRSHGYAISRAPDRLEFRTTWFDWADPLAPYVWNPFYEVPEYRSPEMLAVMELCPPAPAQQNFYEFD